MKKNLILMMLSSILLSLFVFSSCKKDKDEPKNDLYGRTFVGTEAEEGKNYTAELYFASASKLKLSLMFNKLPEAVFEGLGDLENAETIKEKIIALFEQGQLNQLPIYLNYSYNKQTGAITLEASDDGLKAFSDLMANKILPIVLAEKLQEMNELQKKIALEGMRKAGEMQMKLAIQTALQAIQSVVYKKDEAKIYLRAINPQTQGVETTIFTEK